MTIMEAIHYTDKLVPNGYGQTEKLRWLSELDGMIRKEIIDAHEGGDEKDFAGYGEQTDPSQELLAPFPFDMMYIYWLESRMNYASGEYGKYNNSVSHFNVAYETYEKCYRRDHKPKGAAYAHF